MESQRAVRTQIPVESESLVKRRLDPFIALVLASFCVTALLVGPLLAFTHA